MFATLALYGLIMVPSSFGHHDFACHQKSPTHCTSCTSNQLAPGVEQDDPLNDSVLADQGQVVSVRPAHADSTLTGSVSDRSPPSV